MTWIPWTQIFADCVTVRMRICQMVSITDIAFGLRCVLLGVRDSIFGIFPVFHLIKQNEKIRKQLLQCFLLNGVILGLSILTFDYVLLPTIQFTARLAYGIISDPSQSGILQWLGTILSYVFTGFWVLPVFWISKPINSIWFQDIASAAFHKTQKQTKRKAKSHQSGSSSLSQSISRFLADMLFSVVLEMLFLVQAMLVGLIPGIGAVLSLFHLAVLYALYSFEYKWIYQGTIINQRVAYIERNWPYFLGFGLPLSVVTALPSSLVISACTFAVAFPLFIVSANDAKPEESTVSQIPIFKIVVILTNKLFNRSDPTLTSVSARGSTTKR